MAAYGFGYLWDVQFGEDIASYLMQIDATLEPFGGRFVAHGGENEVLEGDLPTGNVILLEFPDLDHARYWYASEAYQLIKSLRTNSSKAHILLVDGVEYGHKAKDLVAKLIQQQPQLNMQQLGK
jgi:uncharacterized protein (DUF1330 family)